MRFWDRLFNAQPEERGEPIIRFGRYSDSYKTAAQYDAWRLALQQYESANYRESFLSFLRYLRDESEENVHWQEYPNRLEFEFFQGSKRIVGQADQDRLRVMAPIARLQEKRLTLLEFLIGQNFQLKYGRYALDPQDQILLVFDSFTTDASPHKLYYGLREVALQADKQDDLLLEEFQHLAPVAADHLQEIEPREKQVKIDFITQHIQQTLDRIDQKMIDPEQHPGAIAYVLLSLIYKIDYLVKPEGYTTETLERAHRQYFTRGNQTSRMERNQQLIDTFRELLQRNEAAYSSEMYRGRSTFGITPHVTHDRVVTLIDNELHQMDWYQDNGMPEVALAVSDYIAGYCLFNYAVPEPDRDLLHLYFRIIENEYFRALGFKQQFCDPNRTQLNRRNIRAAIQHIVQRYQSQYRHLRPALSLLQFDTKPNFARTYLQMIRQLDLTSF